MHGAHIIEGILNFLFLAFPSGPQWGCTSKGLMGSKGSALISKWNKDYGR